MNFARLGLKIKFTGRRKLRFALALAILTGDRSKAKICGKVFLIVENFCCPVNNSNCAKIIENPTRSNL